MTIARLKSVAICVVALAMSACSSIDVNALPAPGQSFQDGYDVVMEFENVLNLPARAKVTLDGVNVGVVTNVAVSGNHVDVAARIDRNVALPDDIRAELQQATVLGDIYVGLQRPRGAEVNAAMLQPGTRIPLAQTTSPPQLEDTIANLANFVGSGTIQRVQNTVIGLNRVTPPGDDVRRIASRFSTNLADLSNNIDNVDLLLQGTSQLAAVLQDHSQSFNYWFSPEGMTSWDRTLFMLTYASNGIPSVGSIYAGGFWLVPFLNSLADAMGSIQQSKWAFESEVPKWRRLFTDYFLPQDKYPAINITSIEGPDGREMSGDVEDVLRILGGMP